MDLNKMTRYCELKKQFDEIEKELKVLRDEMITHFQTPEEIKIGQHTMKIFFREKRTYDDKLLLATFPDLWPRMSTANNEKINNLIKVELLNEESIQGTYNVTRIPFINVK
jgi:hypothetical protein